MHILLIANYLPDRQESMLRYADMLARELRARDHTVTVVHPPVVLRNWFGAGFPGSKWLGYIDKYILAPGFLRARCREARADVVHVCDHSNSMYLRSVAGWPSLITCHDLLAVFTAQGRFPGEHTGFTGRLLQRWIASGLLRARNIVCISAKTEHDVLELAGNSPPRTFVVHHSLNWEFHPVAAGEGLRTLAARQVEVSHGYLLHVGNNSWYKNRQGTVRIFSALKKTALFSELKLILAGKPWDDGLRAAVTNSGVGSDIVEILGASNEELRALYSDAIALIFPSREEGFGWPILEAQACGCPVITTNHAPMTEIAGSAALFIDPDDPTAAAQSIVEQSERLAVLRLEGLENVKRFSIDKAMSAYEAIYRQVIAKSRPVPGAAL